MPKDNTQISAEVIVEILSEAQRKRSSEAEVTVQLIEAGLSPVQLADAYHMFGCGQSRAMVESTGATATADYDDDPIFQASLKKARERLPPSGRARTQRMISAIAAGVAILVGLFAIGAVVYAVISLLRESH